jgi:hypothetical protein
VIRRLFWLILGAVGGIVGYRRVAALGRRAKQRSLVTVAARTAHAAHKTSRETISFTRDVRDGMGEYMARQQGPEGPTLNRPTNDERAS